MSAILGSKPTFNLQINIVKPVLPVFTDMERGVHSILDSGMVTKGRYLFEFEEAIAAHLGVKHAIGVSSCTTGLMLTYQSLGLQGEVIVPSFTFMATVSALNWCGIRPIFCDVNSKTTNLNPALIESLITSQTTAIVAVHNFGNPAEIGSLEKIAKNHGIKLIFDAAHGFGAKYYGFPVGKQGNAQVFSLSPTKLLIAGEGGIVATNDDSLAEKVKMGREYGNDGKYDSAFAGMNARMPEFNALMGLRSLDLLEKAAVSRNETARIYVERLGRLPGISFQDVAHNNRSSYKDFSITIDENLFGLSRDELAQSLRFENIDTRNYYDPPIHRQTAYQHFYNGRELPGTDLLAKTSLSLPIWTEMDHEITSGICKAIEGIFENRQAIREHLNRGNQSYGFLPS